MVQRNPHFHKLIAGYLFPEIQKRVKIYTDQHSDATLLNLSIGDTSQPIPSSIIQGFNKKIKSLSQKSTYQGYGPEQGSFALRKKIAEYIYKHQIDPDEIFITDGAKCDIGRLQLLFSQEATIAVQDPSYPVYVDTSVMLGRTKHYDENYAQYKGICYLPCLPENQFFPDLSIAIPTDIIFFCSPNNPTGAVVTKEQLKELVDFAKAHKSIIIFDAAYSSFIQDPSLPRSIYEIEGSEKVAIEVNSFSKMAGFTGIRLGWTVIPRQLLFEDGSSVHRDFTRIITTFFNGASNIAQEGGLEVFSQQGLVDTTKIQSYYLNNAAILKECFQKLNFAVFGGENVPFLWVKFPGVNSWAQWEFFLNHTQIIATPGVGFGAKGEEFLRFSGFCDRTHILEAICRLNRFFSKLHLLKNDQFFQANEVLKEV